MEAELTEENFIKDIQALFSKYSITVNSYDQYSDEDDFIGVEYSFQSIDNSIYIDCDDIMKALILKEPK